jgi:LuxR family maltose regulon positive regulatory protein
VLARPRLHSRLNLGLERTLTLVSAPAGFGKTMLLTDWLAATSTDRPVAAWLALDERDNDPVVFWTYVTTAAYAATAPEVGAEALPSIEVPRSPIETVLTTLLNDLDAVSDELVLVLDDYHVIESGDVQDGMAYLLDHLPAHVHVVIATRADPALPLARLRGGGELAEVRATDLRFTPDESAAYLDQAVGSVLTAQDVAALNGRTEGWVAALQLAALSLQGRDDIAGFAGDDRYIVDYLSEEVLQRQPDDVQRFLVQTSILERLCGSLCDAVTGQTHGNATLAALERGNLFLTPLDDRRWWYRYHQLFADVLRARLLEEEADGVADLHRRASAWYEQHDEQSDAIHHALAAGDNERAADLIELAIPGLRRSRQEATILDWCRALPDELVGNRPVIGVGLAGALLASGDVEAAEAPLGNAERWLQTTVDGSRRPGAPSADMVVVDDEQARRLPGTIELYRAAQALARGDPITCKRRAARATRSRGCRRPPVACRGSRIPGPGVVGGRRPRRGAQGVRRVHDRTAAHRARLGRPRVRHRAG